MMTTTEILSEIQLLPRGEVKKISKKIDDFLFKNEAVELEQREQEFAEYLLEKGAISNIPNNTESDAEFAAFEPIEFEGEPLSEQIIREKI